MYPRTRSSSRCASAFAKGLANNSLIRTTATTRPRMTRRSVAPHRPTARRYVRLGTVHLVEVDGVGAQAAQRIFELGDDPAARDAAVAGVVATRKNGEPHALHEPRRRGALAAARIASLNVCRR